MNEIRNLIEKYDDLSCEIMRVLRNIIKSKGFMNIQSDDLDPLVLTMYDGEGNVENVEVETLEIDGLNVLVNGEWDVYPEHARYILEYLEEI